MLSALSLNRRVERLASEAVAFMDEHRLQPNCADEAALLSARKQINIAYIAGPISLILGGLLLGTVGLILGILAWRKLNALVRKQSLLAQDAKLLIKSAKIAIVVCAIAMVLNFVSFIIVYPQIMEMIDSGQFDYLISSSTGATGTSTSGSTWG